MKINNSKVKNAIIKVTLEIIKDNLKLERTYQMNLTTMKCMLPLATPLLNLAIILKFREWTRTSVAEQLCFAELESGGYGCC